MVAYQVGAPPQECGAAGGFSGKENSMK